MKGLEKKYFLNKLELLFSAREKFLNSFKSRFFPIKNLDKIPTREPATEPTKATKVKKAKTIRKISSLKLREEFLNKIKNEKKNEQIFRDYILYQTPSYLTKGLYDSDEIKNDEIIKKWIN